MPPYSPTTVIPEEAKNTQFRVFIDELANDPVMQNLSIVEMTVTDSLLAPSTQTTIKIHDGIHTNPVKNLDKFAGKKMRISMVRPMLEYIGYNPFLEIEQTIYRLANRKPLNNAVEKYNMHGCDDTLLRNSAKRISKSWDCVLPSSVTSDVLNNCISAPRIDIESAGPNRPYIAENLHPFQVIAQQADVALYGGVDPCFLHYMTLKDGGTHHFRSLKSLVDASPVFKFTYQEKGLNDTYSNPFAILSYHFPCDFDVLSDIENGINLDGSKNVSLLSINPFNYKRILHGAGVSACGFGGAIYNSAFTNQGTGPAAGTCETKSELYMLDRQARLALLDHDKMALQIVVPFNPNIFSGNVIECEFANKTTNKLVEPDYGSGKYLVTTVSHSVKTTGMGVTMIDCVSRGVGLSG